MIKYAVIVAGGSGQRMGTTIPKQFLLLKGKPVLYHTIKTFLNAFEDFNIVLVLPKVHIEKGKEIINKLNIDNNIQFVEGGDSRFESVKNGLATVPVDSIVFIHDAVRCMLTVDLINRCYHQAVEKGSAIPAVVATDSIRIDEGNNHHTIDRDKIRIIQTPQTFKASIVKDAFKQPFNPMFTDEATVVEAAGQEVFLIEGEYNNLKVTRPIDLFIAEKILEELSFKQL